MATGQRTKPDPKQTPTQPKLRWGWRQLTSMRTALFLLLLAIEAVPGSVLPSTAP